MKVAFMIIVVLLIAGCAAKYPDDEMKQQVPVSLTPQSKLPDAYNPALKDERQKFINELKAIGFVGDMQVRDHMCCSVVGKDFASISKEDQHIIVQNLFEWGLDRDKECKGVVVRDIFNNNVVRTYIYSDTIKGFRVE